MLNMSTSSEAPRQLDKKELVDQRKVFYIPEGYVSMEENMPGLRYALRGNSTKKFEIQIVEIAERNGYEVIEDKEFDAKNARAMGIDSGLARTMNQLEQDDYLAGKIDIPMPRRVDIARVVDTETPLVAKQINQHGGEGIYLLEEKSQKIRFVSWLLSLGRAKSLSELENLMQRVESGDLNPLINGSVEKKWYFENYVETPSDYHTSFRVLVDCFGKAHYGSLIRSAEKKKKDNPNNNLKLKNKELEKFIVVMTAGGTRVDEFLINPDSPLYLDAKSIVSNTAMGGKSLLLTGERVIDPEDRKVLLAHNIDPDNPLTPEELLIASQIIGIESRGDYPYVGVDFVLSADGVFN
jgi:hypothetical protein